MNHKIYVQGRQYEVQGTAADIVPTPRGKEQYPDHSGYYEGIPCTCQKECTNYCKGECGCRACQAAYGDFLGAE